MKNKLIRYFAIWGLSVLAFTAVPGADTLESSPWVGWRQGFQAYDQAEVYKMDGNYSKALDSYTRSRDYFAAIQRYFPEWNSKVVGERVKLCENQIAQMRMNLERAERAGKTEPQKLKRNDSAYSRPGRDTESRTGTYTSTASGEVPSSRLYLEMQSELDQYRRRLRKALSEIDDLQVKLQQSEARSRDTESLLKENRSLQEKYDLLELQFKELQSKTSSFDQERYESQLVSLKHTNEEAMKQIKLLENELRNKDQDYAASRGEVLKHRNEVLTLTNEVRRLNREVEQLRSRAAEAGKIRALNERIAGLENELKSKELRIERLMKLLSQSANDGSTANTALNDEIKRLKGEVEQLRKSSGQESKLRRRISDLTAAESELQQQMAELTETLKQRNTELQALKNDDQIHRNKLEKSAREIRDLEGRCQALENEIKNMANRYSELEKRYQDRLRSDAANQEKLQQEKLQIEKKLNAAVSDLRKTSDELEKVRKEYAASENLLKESRGRLIELTAKLQSAEVELSKMNEVQKAYDEMKNRMEEFRKASNSDVLTALNRIPTLEETLRRSEKENKVLLDENDALKKKLRQLEAAARTAAEQNKTLTYQLETLRKSGAREPQTGTLPAAPPAVEPTEPVVPVKVETAVEPVRTEQIENYLAEGRSARNRGNFEIAKWNFRQVLMRDPDNLEASALLGVLYYQEGRFDDAVELLTPVIVKINDDEAVINALARSLIALRKYDEALKVISELRTRRNGRASARMLLAEAVVWSRKGDNQKAEEFFKLVLELDGNNAEAPYELALMLSADPGRLQEAGEFYRLALANGVEQDSYLEEVLRSSNNSSTTCEFMLGNVREALLKNDMVSAAWYFEEAEKIDKDNFDVALMREVLALLNGQHDLVADRLKSCSDSRQKFLLALALLRSGKSAEAEAIIDRMPVMLKTALPDEVLKQFIRQHGKASPVGDRKVYVKLLKKLP